MASVHALHPRGAAPARRLRQRTLEITFVESDAEAYSFTFGQSGDGDE
ncbi:MAG TPA: hypothetical protein VFX51_02700 [Solirubrobacteraceae bacterium]|nr:hypothetical protein [Solirubrobacteraceae bacterium]